jgi:osmotically-inducible protein OsmY
MRRGDYDRGPRFASQDYTGGGRFYGTDGERIYREDYSYSPSRERYHADGYGQPGYDDEFRATRMASGGTGGYDYERGYGDGGRSQYGRDSRSDRFEDAGRSAGAFLHRAGEKVASWFNAGGEAAIYDPNYLDPDRGDGRETRSRGARGLGPQGYKRSDERISDDAHDRLTDDAWLDASNISISVSSGEITLSGTVDSREAKHRAERLVEDLPGVGHVQNNLRVARGNFLTSPTSGYGDSLLEAQMRKDEPGANGAGGDAPATGRKN